jgi:hypothetical protein
MTSEDFVAGVDALLPVLTILATGLVTLVVAVLTAKSTRKTEQDKMEAEKARDKARFAHEKSVALADLERAELVARQQRDDAEAAARKVADEEEAARAKAVAELFFGLILYIESHNPEQGDDTRFDKYFAEQWPTSEVDLRRAIGALHDGELRNRLINLVSAMTDTEVASYHGSSSKGWVGWLSDIAVDLAMTASRMEEPDSQLLERYDAFFASVTDVYTYREEQWETQREARQDQLRDIGRQER